MLPIILVTTPLFSVAIIRVKVVLLIGLTTRASTLPAIRFAKLASPVLLRGRFKGPAQFHSRENNKKIIAATRRLSDFLKYILSTFEPYTNSTNTFFPPRTAVLFFSRRMQLQFLALLFKRAMYLR